MGKTCFRVLAVLVVAGSWALAENAPDAAAVEAMIAAMREAAMAFDSRLPDFICTQVTRREVRREASQMSGVRTTGSRGGSSVPTGSVDASWKAVDSIEEQLTYFGHRETYQVVAVDGRRVAPGQPPETGMKSTGEFGSTLGGIFDPLSHAQFKWKKWDKLRGIPVYVFSFSVAQEHSAAALIAGSARVVAGYHGLLYVERETNSVMRLTTEAETPPDFPLQHVTHVLDYGHVVIAGERFLLPLRSEMQSRASEDFLQNGRIGGSSPQMTLRNTIDFRGFRKYGVESALKPE